MPRTPVKRYLMSVDSPTWIDAVLETMTGDIDFVLGDDDTPLPDHAGTLIWLLQDAKAHGVNLADQYRKLMQKVRAEDGV